MSRRAWRSPVALAAVLAVWGAAACLDISSPVSGIASITPVILPSPSVVVDDSLRDSVGTVDSLRVYAFGPNGDTVRDVVVRFIAFDTAGGLSVDSVTGRAFGKKLSTTGQVVARLTPANGKGVIQTLPVRLPIVPVPVSATRDSDITFTFVPRADTLSTDLFSHPISVTLHGGRDTVVQSYLVRFEVVEFPESGAGSGKPVVLASASSTHDSSVAVTGPGGQAAVRLRVRPSAIRSEVLLGQITDTVKVRVHIQYQGTELPVAPDAVFVIPVKGSIAP